MKSLNLIISILLLAISCNIYVYSQDITKGNRFYFILIPGQVAPEDTVAEVSIFSKYETEVVVSKNGQKIRENIRTIENDYISFSLTAEEAQAITIFNMQPREGISANSAIEIAVVGDEFATCIIRTNYGNMSDGMSVFDISKAGYNYQVSNPANSYFVDNTPSNYTAIIAIHDDTKMTFRMGGCETCAAMKSDGSLLPYNGTIRRTINQGEVWYIPAYGANSVLTGSQIKTNKSVLVFSGSNKAIGIDGSYNYTIHQEIPENSWGKSYLLPQLFGSPHEPQITIFAKSPYTKFHYNDKYIAQILTPGGVINTGYYQGIAKDKDIPNVSTIEVSSDSIINVVMTDPNVMYNNKQILPFQMQILPTELFSKTAVVNIKDDQTDFLNIVYLTSNDGSIPDNMEFAEVVAGKMLWKKLSSYSPEVGLPYQKLLEDGKRYSTKNLKFKAGTYHIRSAQPFAAYQYGYSDKGAYGFPINCFNNASNYTDSVAPYVEFSQCCKCKITGQVIDEPRKNSEIRSNIGIIYMKKDNSYNFSFTHDIFNAGIDSMTTWYLEVDNERLDAQAHLVFYDKAGNRKDTIIKCPTLIPEVFLQNNKIDTINLNKEAINRKITTEISRFSEMNISKNFELYIILDSDSTEQKIGDINTYQNFDIGVLRDLNLYPDVANNKIVKAEITFKSTKTGKFKDSIGYIIIQRNPFSVIHRKYIDELSAFVGDSYISVDDYEFEATELTFRKDTKMRISNPNSGSSETALDLRINKITLVGQNLGFFGSGKSFEFGLPNDISDENPLIIKPNEFYEYDVKFEPKEVMEYIVAVIFEADADKPQNTSRIKGSGLTTSISEDQKIFSTIQIHEENGSLKLFSQENYFLNEIEIYDFSGKLVDKFEVERELNGYSVEKKFISKGVYIINFHVNGMWVRKKIILQ